MRISDILATKRTLSVELWPPRTAAAAERLTTTLEHLEVLRPDFASITYGAGGSTRERTHELVVAIERAKKMTPMAHLTTAAHRREELVSILERYESSGIMNLLCLRGDRPLDAPDPLEQGELAHASDLVTLAKARGMFCVAVAAHPEGHPSSPDLPTDRRRTAEKLMLADFAITQFFFRLDDYLGLVADLKALGVEKPVLPGIMPITNIRTVERMAELSGCAVPSDIVRRIQAVADDPAAVRAIGVEVATSLCAELLDCGVPGLHFYTMNQVSATFEVCENLHLV